MFIVNIDEENFKALHKKYNIPEDCPNEIRLQDIQNLSVKTAYAVTDAYGKTLNKMGKLK